MCTSDMLAEWAKKHSMIHLLARLSYSGSLFLLITLALVVPAPVDAVSIRINTGNDGKSLARGAPDPSVTWNYTGDYDTSRFNSYVDNDPAFPGPTTLGTCHMQGGNCRLGSNTNYGPDVAASYPAYLGVQFFYLAFDLPTLATNISLEVAEIGADDRVGMHLNDNEIGYWGNHTGVDLTGVIDGSDVYAATSIGAGVQGSLSGITLHSPFGYPDFSLIDPALFNIGGTNVIRLWVNNTNSRVSTAHARPMRSGDPTVLGFDASLSYDIAIVPEPTTFALMGLGLAGIGYRRRQLMKA